MMNYNIQKGLIYKLPILEQIVYEHKVDVLLLAEIDFQPHCPIHTIEGVAKACLNQALSRSGGYVYI